MKMKTGGDTEVESINPSDWMQDLVNLLNRPGGQLEQTHLYLEPQPANDYMGAEPTASRVLDASRRLYVALRAAEHSTRAPDGAVSFSERFLKRISAL